MNQITCIPTCFFVFTADLECSYCISLAGDELKKHETAWEESSKEYDADRDKAESANHSQVTHPIISVDLQKVMLLPHMPRTKEAYFMSRLVTFHLTVNGVTDSACHMIAVMPSQRNLPFSFVSILGHTSMSADSFHAVVEGKMRRREVLDWSDFLTLVRTCLDRPVNPPEVVSMTHDQFYEIDTKKLLKPNYSVSSNHCCFLL